MEEPLKRLANAACAVHRVANKLPADDPMVRLLKEAALSATASCAISFYAPEAYNENKAHGDIATLCGYFVVAREQNWIDSRNFDILIKEYQAIKELIASIGLPGNPIEANPSETKWQTSRNVGGKNDFAQLTQRQKRIFSHMKEKEGGEVSLRDLRALFPDIASRTVQRDMQALLEMELIVKEGTTHNTTYRLN